MVGLEEHGAHNAHSDFMKCPPPPPLLSVLLLLFVLVLMVEDKQAVRDQRADKTNSTTHLFCSLLPDQPWHSVEKQAVKESQVEST